MQFEKKGLSLNYIKCYFVLLLALHNNNTISTLKLIILTLFFWLKNFKKPQVILVYDFRFLKFLSQKNFVRIINFKVEMV